MKDEWVEVNHHQDHDNSESKVQWSYPWSGRNLKPYDQHSKVPSILDSPASTRLLSGRPCSRLGL